MAGVTNTYGYCCRELERRGQQTALSERLKFMTKQFKILRSLLKRCGKDVSTASILLTFSSSLRAMIIDLRPQYISNQTWRKLNTGLDALYDGALRSNDVVEVLKNVKKFITGKYSNAWLEYSISKLKNRFSDSSVAEKLAPAALMKHQETLSKSVDSIGSDELERVKSITRRLLLGVDFNIWSIPTISNRATIECRIPEGGKKRALYDVLYRVYKACIEDEVHGPTIVLSTEERQEKVLHSSKWASEVLRGMSNPHYDRTRVEVVTVPGPLKARAITKETASNAFFEFARKGVWKRLCRWPMFLIDGPVKVEDIPRRNETEEYVSADYTAATDGFHPEVSEAILGVIWEYLSEYLEDEFLGSLDEDEIPDFKIIISHIEKNFTSLLTQKELNYKQKKGCLKVPQKRGQLMGNLMSFPVLCIYNFCVFQMAREKLIGVELPLHDRVRINGDDILFPAERDEFLCWKSSCDELGMELNVLKTQVSKKACNLNSQLFEERREGLKKVYSYLTFSQHSVPLCERERLRMESLKLCGEGDEGNALGGGLFYRPRSGGCEEIKLKALSYRNGLEILFDQLLGSPKSFSPKE